MRNHKRSVRQDDGQGVAYLDPPGGRRYAGPTVRDRVVDSPLIGPDQTTPVLQEIVVVVVVFTAYNDEPTVRQHSRGVVKRRVSRFRGCARITIGAIRWRRHLAPGPIDIAAAIVGGERPPAARTQENILD